MAGISSRGSVLIRRLGGNSVSNGSARRDLESLMMTMVIRHASANAASRASPATAQGEEEGTGRQGTRAGVRPKGKLA